MWDANNGKYDTYMSTFLGNIFAPAIMAQKMKKEAAHFFEATQITVFIFDLVRQIEYPFTYKVRREYILEQFVVLGENHEMSWTRNLREHECWKFGRCETATSIYIIS